MYIDCELVTTAYKSRRLKAGMLFINNTKDPPEMHELDKDVPVYLEDAYIMNNGHPIELGLFDKSLTFQLAKHEEIAWVDEEDSEDMHTLTIKDINSILRNNNRCQIQIKDKLYEREKMIIPIYDEEMVIIKLIKEE